MMAPANIFVVTVLIVVGVVSENLSKPFELSIIHFNDFHARFEETTTSGGICKQPGKCIGGFSRMYKQIMTMLKENPNSILLSAGDHFQGTAWYSLGKWNVTQEFMNKLPLDAETIGNHEFEDGIDGLVPYIKALKHPVVASNIDDSSEIRFQNIYKKSVIIERYGRKIGIIGVVAKDYPLLATTEKLKFLDESESVNKEADRLVKEEGVFTNIVLSHGGYEVDQQIAAKASEKISLIVGGHTHTFLYTGDNPPGPDVIGGPYPTIVTSKYGHKVLITQASSFCKYLGNITIYLDNAGEIIDYSGAPIFLGSHFPQDEQINAALQPWKALIDTKAPTIIGSSLVTLSANGCNKHECTLGNFVADAMVYAYTKDAPENAWTKAAIAITNPSSLRTDIEIGSVTYEDLLTACPFNNTIDFGVLKGRHLKELLEFTVSTYSKNAPDAALNLLQFSGIQVVYDLSRMVGDRVVSVKVRCQNCTIPKYEDLNINADYNVLVNNFIGDGKGGFTMLPEIIKDKKVGPIDIDVLVEYLKRRSPAYQEQFGRISFISYVIV